MADVKLVLDYGGHQAKAQISIKGDFLDLLERIRGKGSKNPIDEFAYLVANDVNEIIHDRHTIRELIKEIAVQVDEKEASQQ
jgi:hypothetical protein